jgi:hypothetical protein
LRLGVVLLCTAAVGAAQDAGDVGVVLRSITRLVQVSVIAQHKGQPVRDLQASDFTILDNGRPRPVAAFSIEEQRAVTGTA